HTGSSAARRANASSPATLPFVRPVGGDQNPCTGRLRVHEPQSLQIAPPGEKTLPATDDDRMNHEGKFIEQVVSQQRPNECRAAGDADVLARLLFQPGDCFPQVTLDERGVSP